MVRRTPLSLSFARSILPAMALILTLAGMARSQPAPLYLDPAQPAEKRVADLISRLTLEEKAALLNHRGPGVERLGIKSDKWNQCLHGVWWTAPRSSTSAAILTGGASTSATARTRS